MIKQGKSAGVYSDKTGEISRSVQIKMAGDGKTGEISRVYSDRCWLAMAKQGRSAGVYLSLIHI